MIEDLSRHHQLICDPFKKPQTPDEWAEYRLSEEQVEFYGGHRDLIGMRLAAGHLSLDGLVQFEQTSIGARLCLARASVNSLKADVSVCSRQVSAQKERAENQGDDARPRKPRSMN